jgi:hypothetical protein
MDPRAGLDDVEKRKFFTPPGLEPLGRPAHLVAIPTALPRLTPKYSTNPILLFVNFEQSFAEHQDLKAYRGSKRKPPCILYDTDVDVYWSASGFDLFISN